MQTLPDKILYTTSTVADGNMSLKLADKNEVECNRARWLKTLGISLENFCLMRCDHGEKIVSVSRHDFLTDVEPEAEVLMTNELGLALGLLTADCIPAVFFDPVNHAIALAHLNRRTIAHDLAKKTLAKMYESYGTHPADVLVHFEPHIHAASYQFPAPLTEPTPPLLTPFLIEQNGMVAIDFAAAHKQQLVDVGVQEENISMSSADVATSPDYFSYHVSKTNPNKPTGRHLTIVMLKN